MPGVDKRKRRRWHPRLDESDARDPLKVLLDRVLETPQARGIFDQFQGLIDRAANAIDPQITAPPPPKPRPSPLHIARSIMQFSPDEPLTGEQITKRRRALAAICHPDKGGSTEAMQRLNRAADLLLAQHK